MSRSALVLPGGAYGPQVPLLAYAAEAAEARGATIERVEWRWDAAGMSVDQAGPWVVERLPAVAASTLLIGKSLGTHAASLAADRGLPAVWLTPVLTAPWVVDALRRASAPTLLVGGTADALWDGQLARELSPHVLEVEDANHAMLVPGRLANSAAVLGRVATAVEDFLDNVVWPSVHSGEKTA